MSIGDFLERLSQAMLVGIMLVGRLGVCPSPFTTDLAATTPLAQLVPLSEERKQAVQSLKY